MREGVEETDRLGDREKRKQEREREKQGVEEAGKRRQGR